MNEPCEHLLARAGFTDDQYSAIAGRNAPGEIHESGRAGRSRNGFGLGARCARWLRRVVCLSFNHSYLPRTLVLVGWRLPKLCLVGNGWKNVKAVTAAAGTRRVSVNLP